MISPSDARATLHGLSVAGVARAAWRAADGDTDAAVVLDARTGAVEVLTWSPGFDPDVPPGAVVLAYAPASRVPDLTRALARGLGIPPSPELVEEHIVRASVEAFADGGFARAVAERFAAVLARGAS